MNKNIKVWLVLGLLSLIWSSTWLAIKIGLETLPPFLSAGWRFLTAFIFLFLYSLKLNLPLRFKLDSHLFFIGFAMINFFFGYALVYWGEQYINSGLASVLFSVMPFYVAIFSIKFLPSEKITLKKFLGISVGFAGVVIIFNDQLRLEHPMALAGMAAVLLSPGFSALGTIWAKKARQTYHAVTMNTFPLLYTALIFFSCHLMFEQTRTVTYNGLAILSILHLAIFGTALAFVLFFWLLKTTSAVLMSLVTFLTPPVALIWGWLALGEAITPQLLIGMVVIFSGIAIVRKSS